MSKWEDKSEQEKQRIREQNNRAGAASGAYTGRCGRCESRDLWDDETMYGCNCCGAMYSNM